jgi:DNA modification methylase
MRKGGEMAEIVYDEDGLQLIRGDALAGLALLPDESIDCAVTSPPYLLEPSRLRDGDMGRRRSGMRAPAETGRVRAGERETS